MRITYVIFAALLSFATLSAQPVQDGPRGRNLDAITEYLSLSEQQVLDIEAAKQSIRDAVAAIQEQARQAQENLRAELQQESPNPAIVGQLLIDSRNFQEQVKAARAEARTVVLDVLTEEQVAALAPLEQARNLFPLVRQAAALNLLEEPESDDGPAPDFGRPSRSERPGPRGRR